MDCGSPDVASHQPEIKGLARSGRGLSTKECEGEGLLAAPGSPVDFPSGLDERELRTEELCDLAHGMPSDGQTAAPFRAIGGKRGDNGVTSTSDVACHDHFVAKPLLGIHDEVKDGAVVPHSNRSNLEIQDVTEDKRDGRLIAEPLSCCGQRHRRDIGQDDVQVARAQEMINQSRSPGADVYDSIVGPDTDRGYQI